MAGDLHAQMASGEVGAAPADAVRTPWSRRHRGSRRRDHRALRGGHAGVDPRAAVGHVRSQRRPRPCRRQHDRHRLRRHGRRRCRRHPRRLRRLVTGQPVRHQRRLELHARTRRSRCGRSSTPSCRTTTGAWRRSGSRPRRDRSSTPSRHNRARPAMSWACSCPARCSKRSPSSGRNRRWPRVGRRLDDAGQRQPRRRLAVHHGHVHLRRWCRCTRNEAGTSACSYPTGVAAVPGRSSRHRRRSASSARSCARAAAVKGSRPAGWVRQSSSPSTRPARGSSTPSRRGCATRRRASSAARPGHPDRSPSTASQQRHRSSLDVATRRSRAPRSARWRRIRRAGGRRCWGLT